MVLTFHCYQVKLDVGEKRCDNEEVIVCCIVKNYVPKFTSGDLLKVTGAFYRYFP